MLLRYFKASLHYIRHQKKFSLLNIAGLATGLCVFYFAFLYVHFELSYDCFNKNEANIYRLVTDVQTQTGTEYQSTSAPVAPALEAAFPQIKTAARIFIDNLIIEKDENNFSEEIIAYADASLFKVFTLPLLSGDASAVLEAPYTIVLSQTAAKKYFGNESAIGKTLLLDGKFPAAVTGVMKDMPHNSHFRVDVLVSMSTLLKEWNTSMALNWEHFGFYTYLLLQSQRDATDLETHLPGFIKKHFPASSSKYTLHLEPLKSVYLYGKPRGSRTGTSAHGNISNVYIFSLSAIFILVLASINFINLSTAISLKRAKETGIRKVLGASGKQLALQFLFDALLISIIALLLALMLCMMLLPLFNNITGKIIETHIFNHPLYICMLLTIALITGFLSGIYPAISLSHINAVKSLKTPFNSGAKGFTLRKIFVAIQFTISIVLIIATLVIYNQLNYMRNTNAGFKKDHLLVIDFHFDERILTHTETVKQQLKEVKGVTFASIGSAVIGRANRMLSIDIENSNGHIVNAMWNMYAVDKDFIPQYHLQLAAGRNFSATIPSDTNEAVIINEAAVRALGYPDAKDAIGKRFAFKDKKGLITGVVKDFHFSSYADEIEPLIIKMSPWFFTFIALNISSPDIMQTVNDLQQKWKTIAPGLPFIYSFSDETYDAQYKDEARFGRLFTCFAAIAIFISCLGLYGLSVFSVTQKTKEIGIRKVLGASPLSIISNLSSDFFKPVCIAILIASPLAWLLMQRWLLNNYAYRISISIGIFFAAAAIALLIAFLTICYHSIKAAFVNPVKTLRSE